jgi:hypothetical protein
VKTTNTMKTIRHLIARLFPERKPATILPPSMPLPAHLRRHFEAQDRGDFRP